MISKFLFLCKFRGVSAACLLCLVASMCCVSSAANAQVPDSLGCITNSTIYAIASDASYTYIVGDFSNVSFNSGYGVKLTAASDVYDVSYARVNGTILCSMPDGAGGWYIGGSFTKVGIATRNSLAHILSNGTLDATWNPNANNSVNTMVLSGSDIYVGGAFTNVGGQARARIAKLNNTTGAADATWNPAADNTVYSIAVSGSDIYAGGSFTTIGGQTRNRIAKLNNSTGTADATWNPNANGATRSILIDGSDVYVGGNFTTIGVQTRNYIAKLNNTTGAADASFNPNSGAVVYAMAVLGSSLYVGGDFTTVSGQSRNRIAKLNIITGVADASFNPNSSGTVYSIAISGADIYAGGSFATIGGQTRSNIAKLDTVNGAANVAWDAYTNAQVNSIATNGSDIYAGGNFTIVNRKARNRIARINNATKAIDASWNPNSDALVLTISVSASGIYAGGFFNNIGGLARPGIAKLNNTTGAADPLWNANCNDAITSITTIGPDIYAAGGFTLIGGQNRNFIAKLNTTTGDADATWDANANDAVWCMAVKGGNVYVGGDFTAMGGQTRNYIAKLNNTTGALDASFNPNSNAHINTINAGDAGVYAGGLFSSIGGQTRGYIAKLDDTTGAADTSWNANTNGEVLSIAVDAADIYIGGNFTTAGGQTRNYLARLSSANGAVDTSWNPNLDGKVYAFNVQDSHLNVGGLFNNVGGSPRQNFASFDISVPTYTWTGAVSKIWSLPGNWSGNVVPGPTDAVILPVGTTFAPNLNNVNTTVKNLTVGDLNLTVGTAILTITGKLANYGRITGPGKVLLNGSATQYLTGNGSITNLELNNSNGAIVGIAAGDTLKVLRLLTLTSGTLVTNNKYILSSTGTTSTSTSTIGPIPAGAGISGNVIHHRYLSAPANGSGGRSWRLLTSPLAKNDTSNSIFYNWQNNGVNDGTGLELWNPSGTGAGGNGLAPGNSPSIRSFDYVTNTYVPVTNTKTTMLFTGTSNNTFMVFASGSYGSGHITSGSGVTDAHATGKLITGTQNYTFTPPNASNIYYLMGNPYACPIDFDKVYNNTGTTHINQKFWVIDPSLGSVGAYATVTYTGGVYVKSAGNQNQYIQIGQGFFVEGNSVGIASSVAIEENDKETTAAQTPMFRTNGGSLETFRVKLYRDINSISTQLDGAVVASHQSNNNAIDGVDGVKFGNFNENIGILTSGKVLAIDARQLLDNNDTVKVTLSSMQQTTYQLVIEPGNMSASGLYATLIDNFAHTTMPVSLNSNTTYSFTVTGSALSTGTGRFSVVFNTITPLALKFINTNAVKHGDKVDVQWAVASQDGIQTYDVERSSDAKDFSKIGTVTVSADNTYNYADEAPLNGSNYYRVKAIARSSNSGVYSNIVRVNMNSLGAELNVYPNPVKDGHMQVSVSNLTTGVYTISLYNAAGQKAATKQLSYEGGSAVIEMNVASLANGIYIMHLTNDKGETIAEQKIIKQ